MHSNSAASGLENPIDYKEQNEYLGSLAYLAAMPFHHLLSTERIYSSIIAESPDVKIPGILESPAERLQMFQKAAADQIVPGAEAVPLDRFLQIKFSDADFEGEKIEVGWLVVFRDELQGCAEIYRAEMLLFKRLLYEQKEELQTPLIITNEKFQDYIDYELFDRLTNNHTDRLFIKSLSAGYQISVTSFDEEEENSEDDESGAAILTDRIHDCISHYADYKDFERFEIKSDKSLINDSPIGDAAEKDDNSGRIAEQSESNTKKDKKDKKDALRIFELNIAAYWRKWRQAAQLAGFDFDLLERLADPPVIRFYELTKLLRLASLGEYSKKFSNELEIEYELFTQLMPLPKFRNADEIKQQITNLIQPLIINGYVRDFRLAEDHSKKDSVQRLKFDFCN